MKFKNKNKKAELSTEQIVLLLILIISFIVILIFLFILRPGQESEKEACRQSVVLRGNSAIPANSIPLKCQINYLCITKDGSCEGITTKNIEKVKTEEELYEVLAKEMADCWWMFGEGEVNYVGRDFKQNLYCSICTQFILDDSLGEIENIEDGRIDEKRFYQYLGGKEYADSDMSYLQYLANAKSFNSFESSFSSQGGGFGYYEFGEPYYIMMGIYSDVGVKQWTLAGAGIGAAALIAAPFTGGTTLSYFLIVGGAVAGAKGGNYLGKTIEGKSGYEYLTPVIIKANSDEFRVFECKDVMTSA